MAIAIKVSRAEQIRRLKASGLDAEDIVKLTSWPRTTVDRALSYRKNTAAGRK